MRQWSDLLLREILGWPNVSSRPIFGMTAVYRGNAIFAGKSVRRPDRWLPGDKAWREFRQKSPERPARVPSFQFHSHAKRSVGRMNADSDRVPGLNSVRIQLKQRLIDKNGVAKTFRRGGSEHVLPTRSDHRGSERHTAGVNQVNIHARRSLFTSYFHLKLTSFPSRFSNVK
jgi:hypothetical protein